MNLYKKILGTSVLCCSLVLPSYAATDDVQILVDELQKLTEKSRQERAADRWLQNALEDLVDKYNFPWKQSLLRDDFSDGDYQRGVRWEVGSGDFWVDRRLGLRSRVEAMAVQEQRQESAPQSDKDLAKALIGSLLKETLGGSDTPSTQQRDTTRYETTPAFIRTGVTIPTTFAVESVFSQNNRPGEAGQFEWRVMQDQAASNGYKLVVTTGERAVIDVVRVRSSRESYLESVELPKLNKGGEFTLSWRQKADGSVDVFIDGQPIIKTRHQAFKYGFKYFSMMNRSGDFSVAGVEVLGGR